MVKRPKSPEVIEEARYFTVCQPFPLYANWLLDEDQKNCATWIAECIGLEHLYAIHYKPSARSMILLEVSKMFTEHERLLGEHHWSEILRDPESEEKDRVSQVFHSFYSTGREAQKDGWKNLSVKSTWFKNWAPGKGRFKKPYPPTYWCPVPVEDRTNKQLCRPLPARKIPPPPRAEQPVVGSSTWAETKIATPTTETLTKAWDEDVSSIDIVSKLIIEPVQPKPNAVPTVSVPMGRKPATTSASTATSAPKETNFSSSQKNKKGKPIPFGQFIEGGRGGNKPSPTWKKPTAPPGASSPVAKSPVDNPSIKPTPRSANAWEKPIQLPVSPAPPKKEAPVENLSSWGQESTTSTVDQENLWKAPLPTKKKSRKKKGGPAIPEASVSSTSPRSTQPSTPQVGNTPSISSTTRDLSPHLNFRPSAGSEEEDSDVDDIYAALSKVKYIENSLEESEHAHISAWERGGTEPDTEEVAGEGKVYGNLWLSEEDPRALPTPKFICPTHRVACNKGICGDMAKMVRAKKLEEQEAEREKAGKGKKNKDKRKKERESGDDNKEGSSNTVEVDGDNFTIARSSDRRRGFGKEKRAQDTPEVGEPSRIGYMRAFPPSGPTTKVEAEAEGELFTQW